MATKRGVEGKRRKGTELKGDKNGKATPLPNQTPVTALVVTLLKWLTSKEMQFDVKSLVTEVYSEIERCSHEIRNLLE